VSGKAKECESDDGKDIIGVINGKEVCAECNLAASTFARSQEASGTSLGAGATGTSLVFVLTGLLERRRQQPDEVEFGRCHELLRYQLI